MKLEKSPAERKEFILDPDFNTLLLNMLPIN